MKNFSNKIKLKKIKYLILAVFLLLLIFVTVKEYSGLPYSKRINWTKRNLYQAKEMVAIFKSIEGRYPNSLQELNNYAIKYNKNSKVPIDDLMREKPFMEYFSTKNGCYDEFGMADGNGGFVYNKNTGEVRVNLTKPVKHYLWFYFGKERNEIPADW